MKRATSANGTKRTSSDIRSSVANRGESRHGDCERRLPVLTQADISSFNMAAEPRSKSSSSERQSPLPRFLSAIYGEYPRLPEDASWR